jgi:hypothetical protein
MKCPPASYPPHHLEGAGTADPRWLIADRQGFIATTSASGAASPLAYGPYGEPSAWSGPGGAMLFLIARFFAQNRCILLRKARGPLPLHRPGCPAGAGAVPLQSPRL